MEITRNIVSAEKFNPPTEHEVFVGGTFAGTCFVYDGPAWRNRNRVKPVADEQREKPRRLAPVRKPVDTWRAAVPGMV